MNRGVHSRGTCDATTTLVSYLAKKVVTKIHVVDACDACDGSAPHCSV